MTGRDPADLMPDPEGEKSAADRALSIRTVAEWPTLEGVRAMFPMPTGRGGGAEAAAADASTVEAVERDAALGGDDAAAEAAGDGGERAGGALLLIPRQRRQAEVDAAAGARRRSLAARLVSRAKAFNALVRNSRVRVAM